MWNLIIKDQLDEIPKDKNLINKKNSKKNTIQVDEETITKAKEQIIQI